MGGKQHTAEQIVRLLREAEVDLAAGLEIGQVCQKLGISRPTFYRWRLRYGGLGVNPLRQLKGLEAENTRLKRLVAELALDNRMLREVVKKKL